nr:glycosyltransferase family 2 protein [Clostridia bacterium]
MSTFNTIILLLGLLSGILLLARIRLFPRRGALPEPEAKTAAEDAARLLSVIIPAYNEELRLPPLLESLRAQDVRPLEILVVDDGSTDRTAEIAAAYAADVVRVIRSEDVGPGWVGKSRACWSGAHVAAGEWLLFLDADVRMDGPGSLARLCAEYRAAGARGMMSWQPYHRTRRLYENLSLVFNIIVTAGINVFTPLGERLPTAGAFGPCLLCGRAAYEAAGGHRTVRTEVLEDLAIGKAVREAGFPVRCRSGHGAVSFRMYPEGLGSLVEGWTKNFGTGAGRIHPLILALCVLWVCGGFAAASALIQLLTLHAGWMYLGPALAYY